MFDLHARRTGLVALIVAVGAVNVAPAAAKPRTAHKSQAPVFSESAFAGLSGADQLAKLAAMTDGGHLAVINNQRYVRHADGSLGGL